ncbi:transcriptional regulator, ArsR family [Brevibacterium sandarakinum]|uniref:Transcriptional regulator, ArsR family n=1 Tax=Brevibacterium sandarakinum TaxID=629680 RepID=A0A1H1UMG2_BRESA|nr:transcriptional regulator, ArsR family [Brevibacterium sandarakinum]
MVIDMNPTTTYRQLSIYGHNGQVTVEQTLPAPASAACCTPLTAEPLDLAEAQDFARILKALADPTRLRLVSLVAAHEGNEACACDLIDPVGLGQPTVSHHLKILVDASVLHREKRGIWSYYSLAADTLERIAAFLSPA